MDRNGHYSRSIHVVYLGASDGHRAGTHQRFLETIKNNLSANKAVLIDVREKSEWDAGHLRNAVLLPLSSIPQKLSGADLAKRFPKGQILYLHCAAGGRCLRAADLMKRTGYDIRPLREGYEALLTNGFPKFER